MIFERFVMVPTASISEKDNVVKACIGKGLGAAAMLAALVLIGYPRWGSGHEGATGIVKERMEAMKEVGRSSKSINQMFKGKRTYSGSEIAALSSRISEHAARIPELFPDRPDSRHGAKTQALPAIWEEWAQFLDLARSMERESQKLGETAATGERAAVRAQLRVLGRTCSGCHDQFRQKKR